MPTVKKNEWLYPLFKFMRRYFSNFGWLYEKWLEFWCWLYERSEQ